MQLVFVFVAILIFFCMFTWVAVTIYRICFPEKPLPIERDPVMQRHHARLSGTMIPVGARDISEEQRAYVMEQMRAHGTVYLPAYPEGLPQAWEEDLQMRRN